jgi:hypothetical protein
MQMNKVALLASAGLGMAFLAACSDSPTTPTKASFVPKSSFVVAGTVTGVSSTPVASEFRICKEGNVAGTFTVTRTNAPAGTTGFTVVGPAYVVQPGTCAVVVEDDSPSTQGSNVTVTETSAGLQAISGQSISTTDGTANLVAPANGATYFINSIHGIRLTFTNNVNAGCTYTQGYYKNHEEVVVAILGVGGTINIGTAARPILLNAAQIDANLETPPKGGNAYLILSHQLITALLNIQSGATAPAGVTAAIASARAILVGGVSAGETADAIALAAILDDFNNGITGPGHCGDEVVR